VINHSRNPIEMQQLSHHWCRLHDRSKSKAIINIISAEFALLRKSKWLRSRY